MNGLPGAMGKEVAAACLRRGMKLAPVGYASLHHPPTHALCRLSTLQAMRGTAFFSRAWAMGSSTPLITSVHQFLFFAIGWFGGFAPVASLRVVAGTLTGGANGARLCRHHGRRYGHHRKRIQKRPGRCSICCVHKIRGVHFGASFGGKLFSSLRRTLGEGLRALLGFCVTCVFFF